MKGSKSPTTLLEFQDRFPDDESCLALLRRVRWPHGFECPRCGGRTSSTIRTRRLEQCSRCRYQASLTAGTVLHGTRTSLRAWFLAIFFLGRHKTGISALQLRKDLGLGSYKTAWTLLHKLRSGLSEPASQRLIGLVEADEAYLGGKRERGAMGRTLKRKSLVAAAVENRGEHAGSLRLSVIPEASGPELGSFVRGVIDQAKTTVRTDGWRSYNDLAARGARHQVKIQGDGSRAPKILPWVHVVFSNLKSFLRGTYHGVSKKHLPRYLQEFTYRFNRRLLEPDLFFYVLRRALRAEPLPYHRLVAE